MKLTMHTFSLCTIFKHLSTAYYLDRRKAYVYITSDLIHFDVLIHDSQLHADAGFWHKVTRRYLLTGACESLSIETKWTATYKATDNVAAADFSITTSIVRSTFVNICIIANQSTKQYYR